MVFLFILAIIFLLIIFSKIKIEIINFRFSSQTKRHINKDYEFIIKLYILSKIPILKINITKTKLERLKLKEKIQNMDLKIIQDTNKFDKKLIASIKKINIDINKFNLKIELGTENACLTSMIIPVISTIISIFLRKNVKKFEN